MVAIFTTAVTLDSIRQSDDYKVWTDMMWRLGKVFTDGDIDVPLDPNDPLFILDQANMIDRNHKSGFISSLSDNPEKVLEEPCGIYLLDIAEDKAEDIQNKYGVICQSSLNLHHDVLTHKGISAELINYEGKKNWTDKYGNWGDIFHEFKTTPTNSAFIIDAHLFANDQFDESKGCYDDKHSDGITNLKKILEQILPEHFSQTYHIGVLLTNTDMAKTEGKHTTSLTNSRIATAINKLKKKLNRQYEISIEVIFFSHSQGHHSLIHNRRILTNTYVLDANYKLAAFSANGKSRESQTVSISPLFELFNLYPDSETKEKRLRSDLNELSKYIETQCDAKSTIDQLYRNGQLLESFSQIRHRFLKKP